MIETETARRHFAARFADLPEVRLAYLFGSRARGKERPDSDFDIAVLVDDAKVLDAGTVNRTIWRLAARLADPVPAQMLHIVLLNGAPSLLRHRVVRDGVLLCQRNKAERVRFSIRTIRDYQDIEPRLREHRRRRIARLREGGTNGGSGDILASARRAGRLLARAAALGEVDEETFVAEPGVGRWAVKKVGGESAE